MALTTDYMGFSERARKNKRYKSLKARNIAAGQRKRAKRKVTAAHTFEPKLPRVDDATVAIPSGATHAPATDTRDRTARPVKATALQDFKDNVARIMADANRTRPWDLPID